MNGCGLRVGTVTVVDGKTLRARVRFDDMRDTRGESMISDWLQVVQRPGTALDLTADGGHTHAPEMATVKDHAHKGSTAETWAPRVNDQVLVLYEGVANGNGFILGVVTPWR